MEYKIEVIMTPHKHDVLDAPYYWCILKNTGKGWCNSGFGWAVTPEEAWREANEQYTRFYSED